MKKAAIAVAVLSAVVSGSTLAATVYDAEGTSLKVGGRLEFRGDFNGKDDSSKEDGKEIEGTMLNKSRVRLNVAGETDIGAGMKGFGFWEAEQKVKSTAGSKSEKETTFEQRYMYVGMKGDFGSLSFGRQDTAGVQISNLSDIGTFTGNQKAFINAGNEQINNTIAYGYDFESFKLKASYIADDEKNSDGYAISGIYSTPVGLDIGLGYAANDLGTDKGSADQIIAGLGYTVGDLYFGATYTTGDKDDKADTEFTGIEVSAQYKITKQFRLIAAYQNQEEETKNVTKDTADFFELTGRYDFTKNFRSYLAYKANGLDEKDTGYKVEDTIRLGLRYDF
ncbi:porin [Vibrio paracholerae]|uniref:porin n=1 Tax=Vibrio paracholerae TaxID=650003 RepID=UPI0020955D79|nr:porin [Vibrio paracholerae]MCO7022118.1 porin [Vibrio paracholerae]